MRNTKLKGNIANSITCIRIAVVPFILCSAPFSKWFYVFYLLGAFSDMVDGTIARKTGTASVFGAKLDSIADTIFIGTCLIKILPAIRFQLWLWLWIAVIVLIKVFNIILGYIYRRQLVMLHTIANKGTGFLLFLLPLFVNFMDDFSYAVIPVGIVATFAAMQEGYLIRKMGKG